jgi:putative transposase
MPYWRHHYHLVWATKHREAAIGPDAEEIIRQSFASTFTRLKLIPHAVGIVPDHVHVAVSIPPSIAVAEVLHGLKGASSHAVNAEILAPEPARFAWQPEYGSLTFGDRSLSMVVDYVLNQREHHAASTLKPEFERTDPLDKGVPK